MKGTVGALRCRAFGTALVLCTIGSGASCPGVFSPGEVFAIGRNCGMCVLADLNGDGNLDLLTGRIALLGDGTGKVGEPLLLAEGPSPLVYDAIAADFDADGRMDVASVDFQRPGVFFRFGKDPPGADIFELPVRVECKEGAWHMALGDLDGNGTPDLVAGSLAGPWLSIVLNNGDRTFRTSAMDPLPQMTQALALGDFDGDGHLDIASGSGQNVMLLFGNGDGTFGGLVMSQLLFEGTPSEVHRFRAADFDGDGRPELVACLGMGLCVYPGTGIRRGEGLVSQAVVAIPFDGNGRFIELADMSRDGLLDMVVLWGSETGQPKLQVWCGLAPTPQAPVAFTPGETFSPAVDDFSAVPALGDMNGDGAIDVAIIYEAGETGQILLDIDTGGPRAPGDANADGKLDIADAVAILSHLFAHKPARCPNATQVNGDAAVDIADAIYLLTHLFARGPAPVGQPRPCRD